MHLSNYKEYTIITKCTGFNMIRSLLTTTHLKHQYNIAIHKSQYSSKTVSIRVAVSCTYSFATKLSIYPCSASNPVERILTLGYIQNKS